MSLERNLTLFDLDSDIWATVDFDYLHGKLKVMRDFIHPLPHHTSTAGEKFVGNLYTPNLIFRGNITFPVAIPTLLVTSSSKNPNLNLYSNTLNAPLDHQQHSRPIQRVKLIRLIKNNNTTSGKDVDNSDRLSCILNLIRRVMFWAPWRLLEILQGQYSASSIADVPENYFNVNFNSLTAPDLEATTDMSLRLPAPQSSDKNSYDSFLPGHQCNLDSGDEAFNVSDIYYIHSNFSSGTLHRYGPLNSRQSRLTLRLGLSDVLQLSRIDVPEGTSIIESSLPAAIFDCADFCAINTTTGKLFLVENNQLHLVPNIAAVSARGITSGNISNVADFWLAYVELGRPIPDIYTDNTLVKSPTSNQVYVVKDLARYAIPDRQTFFRHGWEFDSVIVASEHDLQWLPVKGNI
jgi:hypothetical protein